MGAFVYVSSDVPDCVAQASVELSAVNFRWYRGGSIVGGGCADGGEGAPAFAREAWEPAVDADGLLLASPLGVDAPSEREAVCEQLWRKVYRILFVKQ